MRTLILTLFLFTGFCRLGIAQNTIEVIITDFESEDGQVLVGLYASEEDFLSSAYKSQIAKIVNGQVSVQFTEIPDGIYAVSAFHDENEDENLNMFLGILPVEDYATSNNAPTKFGPPKWKDAKFECRKKEKVVQEIKMM